MPGFFHVNLAENNPTNNKIISWTRIHYTDPNESVDDRTVALEFNVGGWMRFSNRAYPYYNLTNKAPQTIVNTGWDPPGDDPQFPYINQMTYFDGQPLSSRDEDYQQIAVDFFADFVLSIYLVRRYYDVEPIPEVLEILDGNMPETPEDVAKIICANPALLRNIRFQEETFNPAMLSDGARQAILNLLESADTIESYLGSPEAFLLSSNVDLGENESQALVRAAKEKPDLVRAAFDSVELGRAKGDGNTYILLGINFETNTPDQQSLDWLIEQLGDFQRENGFTPSFGFFVTDAQTRHHVVLGPKVTEREIRYLTVFGHNLIDRREGGRIGRIYGDNKRPNNPDNPAQAE